MKGKNMFNLDNTSNEELLAETLRLRAILPNEVKLALKGFAEIIMDCVLNDELSQKEGEDLLLKVSTTVTTDTYPFINTIICILDCIESLPNEVNSNAN
jgi:hypothetical protein